jgi:predicted AAA+ superfamily ATPase
MQIKRTLTKEITDHLNHKEITMITGARQVGKTTLLCEIQERLIKDGHKVLFLNLDNESHSKYFESQDSLIKKASLELGNSGYIFIDEIQRKQNAGIFLKGLYDQQLPYKIVVTGSGSLELKEKIHESLAGRKRQFEMMPVSFKEFVNFKTDYRYENRIEAFFEVETQKCQILLNEYLNYGGYPRIVTEPLAEEKHKLMDEIFRSYIEKDLVYLMQIERPEVFKMLVQILANQTGMPVNYSLLASQVNLSVLTLKKYLWYAEKTFCLQLVSPYYTNFTKEITKAPVYYYTDLGLRNYGIGQMGNLKLSSQLGFVFQNFIFNILREHAAGKGWSVHYWRTTDKAEVDFVINKKNELLPVEVKYGQINKPNISRSFRSFIEKYKPREAWLVSTDYENEITINETKVRFLPFYRI